MLAAPLLLCLLPRAYASPVDLHGFGAAGMSRVGGGVAIADDAGAAFLNPAGLSQLQSPQFTTGYALIRYRFPALPEVYWDTNRDGLLDAADEPLTPDLPDPAADGWIGGLARPLGRRAGAGLALWLPRERLFRLHNFESELPTYFMYENRPQRYALAAGAGVEAWGGLSIGGGVQMIPRVAIDAVFSIDLTASGEAEEVQGAEDIVSAEIDIHDITVDLEAGFSPMLGFRWDLEELTPALKGLSLGGTWRGTSGLPVDIRLDMQINATAEDVGELDPTTVAVILTGGLDLFDHYVPGQLQGGAAWEFKDALALTGDLIYTSWERFTLNVARLIDAELQASLIDFSEVEITDAKQVEAKLLDTLCYRLTDEMRLPEWRLPGRAERGRLSLRGSFGYEPSPLAAQSEATSLLDSDRLLVGAGATFSHGDPLGLVSGPLQWDLFAQYQALAPGSLSRESDAPVAGYPVDGALIPIGGDLFAAGLQWRINYGCPP